MGVVWTGHVLPRVCKAAMFASKLNCVTGQMEWQVTGKDIEQQDTDLSEEFSR